MKLYKLIALFLLLVSQAHTQNSVCFQSMGCDSRGLYVRLTYDCTVRCAADLQFVYYVINASGYVGMTTPVTRYDFPIGQGTKDIVVTNQQANPGNQLVCIKLLAFEKNIINPNLSSGYSFELDPLFQTVCKNAKGDPNCCFSPTPLTNIACNLAVSSTTQPVNCSGGLGSASLSVSGGRLPPYTYLWSNGATTSTVNAPVGTYRVTVTDASGSCSSTQDNIVIASNILSVTPTNGVRQCGAAYGTASIAVSGGSPPYNYSWSNGVTGASSILAIQGTYSVTVTDAMGCNAISSVVIENGCVCSLLLSASVPSESGCPTTPIGTYAVLLQGVSSSPVAPFKYTIRSTSLNSTFTPQYQNNSDLVTYWTVPVGKYQIDVEDAVQCRTSLAIEYIENCPVDCTPHIDNCRSEWQQFLLKNYANGQCKVKLWDTECNTTSTIKRNGKVAIGPNLRSVPNGFNLAVQGGVIANEVKVKLCGNEGWCDYVFDKKYKLMPLLDVNNYIQQNKRLPNMPSTADIEKEGGYELKKLALLQQEKIEEAYLHLIKLEEKVKDAQTQIDSKKQRNNRIAQLIKQ